MFLFQNTNNRRRKTSMFYVSINLLFYKKMQIIKKIRTFLKTNIIFTPKIDQKI